MSFTSRTWYCSCLAAALAVLMLPRAVSADTPSASAEGKNVELFSAIEKGEIDVKVIPKDASQIRVMITNKTKEPLNVKLPKAIAAVPVLAQAAGGGGGSRSRGQSQQQSLGGGMGGGGGGMAGGGGMFSIAPEKVGQLKATTVCLEYGKPEPRPASAYTLEPIEKYTNKQEVQELCQLVGSNKLNQRVAQLAAWHFANGMTWEQLAKIEYRYANGGGEPQFSSQEIQAAMQLSDMVDKVVKQKKEQKKAEEAASRNSPGASENTPAN
jgi:hypothetical protein